MSSLEWPSVDGNGVSLPTIVSNSDLFEGELFGDELIDIYNSATGDSTNQGHVSTDENKHMESEEAVQIAAAAAAMDDGLGAFRPSTSFSDLTTLLSPAGEPTGDATKVEAPASSSTAVVNKATKKRSSPTSATSQPPAKRKPSPKLVRRVSNGALKKAAGEDTSSPGVVQVASPDAGTQQKPNTPDPLDMPALSKSTSNVSGQPSTVKPDTASSSAEAASGSKEDEVSKSGSEADFQAIAQVAVSNLMMNASSTKGSDAVATAAVSNNEKVDISTDHVKALTGNNWVAACSNMSAASGTTASQPADSKAAANSNNNNNNRARRQNLTPDERARQNRDRNREHARNTRLRKKAYVEELKRTLTELVAQRDAAEFEKRQSAQRELEQREVRFRVLEEFLKLRARNEANAARWAAILEDGFTFTIPEVEYQGRQVTSKRNQIALSGVAEIMAESNAFATYLQALGTANEKGAVSFQYTCDRKDFFMDDCNAFMEWTASSSGAVAAGAASELFLKGVVRGKFSPASNKLISATLTFDASCMLEGSPAKGTQGTVSAAADIAAAQAADAILDSLEMPHLAVPATVPSAVNVVHSSCSSSEDSSEKDDVESDVSVAGEKIEDKRVSLQC